MILLRDDFFIGFVICPSEDNGVGLGV